MQDLGLRGVVSKRRMLVAVWFSIPEPAAYMRSRGLDPWCRVFGGHGVLNLKAIMVKAL